MRKILVMFLVVLALLTMAQECQTGTDEGDLTNPFVGGQQGLQITFEEDRPPESVTDGDSWPFYVELILKNMGESYIEGEDVNIQLSGLQADSFGVTDADLIKKGIDQDIFAVEKEEGRTIEPAEVYVTFGEFNYLPDISQNYGPFDIRAEVCYKYSTQAVALGCVLRNPTDPPEQAYCEVSGEKNIYNSGAPLQVSNFVESASGSNRIKYVFTIEHVGPGRFFSPDSGCSDKLRSENKVHFSIDSNVANLNCQPGIGGKEGEIYLGRDGKADVSCIQQTESGSDFLDQIRIKLTYDYLQTQEVPLLVKAD